MNVWRSIIIVLLAIVNLSPASFGIWTLGDNGLTPVNPSLSEYPPRISISSTRAVIDGTEYCLEREENSISLAACKATGTPDLWNSPPDWNVREAFFADLNLDDSQELVLLVWRPFRNWPVDRFIPHGGRIDTFHDKDGNSCHLILIGLKNGMVRELWAGSALVDPIHSLNAVDLDNDGLQELAALEYSYDENPYNASLVVWQWRGFGFSLLSRQKGHFSSLLVIEDTPDYLLAIR